MKNNILLKSFFLSFFTMVLWSSCSDDNELSSVDDHEIENRSIRYSDFLQNTVTKDLILDAKESLAHELSILVMSDTRVFNTFDELITSSRNSSHYEDEFFWNLVKDNDFESLGGTSLSELLIGLSSDNVVLLDYICSNIPALTILKEGDKNNPNTESKIYYDDNFDDMNEESFIPFYQNGIKGETSIVNIPTKKTYIVRECETFISTDDMLSQNYLKTNNPKVLIGKVCGNDILTWTPKS
ncbi:MAG: hypothetical protein V3V14_00340, partial [Saprospiraceae bacterium]